MTAVSKPSGMKHPRQYAVHPAMAAKRRISTAMTAYPDFFSVTAGNDLVFPVLRLMSATALLSPITRPKQ